MNRIAAFYSDHNPTPEEIQDFVNKYWQLTKDDIDVDEILIDLDTETKD